MDEIIAKHAVFAEAGIGGKVAVPLDILCGEHPAVRHRLIVRLFESIGLTKDITASHLEQADRLLKEGRTSSAMDFTAGYAMRISYGMTEFYKKTEPQSIEFEYEININMEGVTEIPELNAEIGVRILRRQDWPEFGRQDFQKKGSGRPERGIEKLAGGKAVCHLSLDKIKATAETDGRRPVLRTRRQGDYIVPLGMPGRKKLQDFFVDEKYPAEERDRTPLLCMGQEVLWAVWPSGGRVSENFKVEDDTERIISLEYSTKI